MPRYKVTVDGKSYAVTADSEADLPAVVEHISQLSKPSAEAAASVSSAAQMPVESGTMLATPIEGAGQGAQQPPPTQTPAEASPQMPQGAPEAQMPPAQPQTPPPSGPSVEDALSKVQGAFAGNPSDIADLTIGAAIHQQNLPAAALRGVAPTVAGAGGGALLGLLAARSPAGAAIGARVGPMAMQGADILTSLGNRAFGTQVPTPSEAVQNFLTRQGVPESVTGAEQLTQAGAQGAAGMLGGIGLGQQLALSAAPKVAKVGRFFAANPVAQTVGGTTGAIASEQTRQQGAGIGGQLAAGLAGAIVPGMALSGIKAIGSAVKEYFTPSGHITKALQQAGGRVPVLNSRATAEIAKAFGSDPELLQAAKSLGLDVDNMSPAMLSKNPQAQSIYFGVQSAKGSQTGIQVAADVQALKEKALDLAEKWGAKDLSELNVEMRDSMKAVQTGLFDKTENIYTELRRLIPAETPVPEGAAVAAVKEVLRGLKGKVKSLSPIEKAILDLAETPAQSAVLEAAKREAAFLAARNGTTVEEELAKMSLPKSSGNQGTYLELDRLRKTVGAKTRGESVFSDATTGEAKHYYKLITEDQNAVAEVLGHKGLVEQGKALVEQRKNLEDQMADLFGKQLDKSFVTRGMRPALSVISKSDSDKLVNLINTIPKEFRKDAIVSGLTSMFSRANSDGAFNPKLFTNFMSGLEKNSVAKTAIFSNLPAETRKEINALAMLSKNYVKGIEERIPTGALTEAFKTTAPLFQKIASYAVTYKGGLFGLIGSHFLNAKTDVLRAADDFLSSGPFLDMVKTSVADPTKFAPAARKVTSSPAFIKFAEAANIPAAARSTFFTLDQDQPQQESQ